MQWSGLLTKWLQSSVTLKMLYVHIGCCGDAGCRGHGTWQRWEPTDGCHSPAPPLCSRAALFLIRSDQSGRTLVNPSHLTHPHHRPLQRGQQPHLHGPTEHSRQMNITVPFCFPSLLPSSYFAFSLARFLPFPPAVQEGLESVNDVIMFTFHRLCSVSLCFIHHHLLPSTSKKVEAKSTFFGFPGV